MLTINSLDHIFNQGEANEVSALRRVNLYVPESQFVTIIGSNGAGKTTLFNVITGVHTPTRGRIQIAGMDVTSWPEHRRALFVGRVFQNPLVGTAASMTIAQNLSLALLRSQQLKLTAAVTAERRSLFYELLTPLELGLEKRLDTQVSLLSGGQRQAMTLLMATLAQTKVLLLDEHTGALDPGTALKILDLTRDIVSNQRITTLMITHNMQQALDFGDRTLMMDKGQIVLDLCIEEKEDMTVQDLVDKFTRVKHEPFLEDELLLSM